MSLSIRDKSVVRGKALFPPNNLPFFGGIRDTAPDAWGRRVIESRLKVPANSLPESVYLLHAGSQRVGALDIRPSLDAEPTLGYRTWEDLRYLMDAAQRIDEGLPVPANLEEIFAEGSPLGGARPKATVRDNEQVLWLAKFPSQKDAVNVPVVETATLRLAAAAGLTVPPVRVIDLGARTVLLIRRFDRYWATRGRDAQLAEDLLSTAPAAGLVEKRLGFVSGLTLLACAAMESPDKSYGDLAHAIRRYCHPRVIRGNNRELFERMVFNIFVSNDDDHLRNHGFVWDPRLPGWRLSPLYDVMPRATLASERRLHLGIGPEGRNATLDNAFAGRDVFTLSAELAAHDRAAPLPADRIESLSASVRHFFETPRPSRFADARAQIPPDRFVYLLDHEYTQRALAWGRLKNSDAERAAALQEVARRLDCEIFLALADVHETWLCEDEYDGYRGRRWDYYDEDDDAENETGNGYAPVGTPEPTDLIDSDVELRHWVGSSGRPRGIPAGVGSDELCFTKPTRDFDPFESDYEPYTGNAGNTVDRWYHRAAVVLWPRERTFVIRAKASPRWAIGRVAQKLDAGHTADALELGRRLMPFWSNCASIEERKGLLEGTLKLAAKLADPDTAAALLQPFTLLEITAKLAPRLPELLDRYGTEWCRSLFKQWTPESNVCETADARPKWISSALAPICRALGADGSSDGRTLTAEILMQQQGWLFRHIKLTLEMGSSDATIARGLVDLGRPILGLLEACRAVEQSEVDEAVVNLLTEEMVEHTVHLQLGLLRAAHEHRRPGTISVLKKVHARGIKDVKTRIAEPIRSHDDWSIKVSLRCRCEICVILQGAVQFSDDHMYMFYVARTPRSRDRIDFDNEDGSLEETTLTKIFPLAKGRKLFYWFDFGDDWKFSIERTRAGPQPADVSDGLGLAGGQGDLGNGWPSHATPALL